MAEYQDTFMGFPGYVIRTSPYYDSRTYVAGEAIEFGQPVFLRDVPSGTEGHVFLLAGQAQDVTTTQRFVGIAERNVRQERYEAGDVATIATSGLIAVPYSSVETNEVNIWDPAYVTYENTMSRLDSKAGFQNLRIGRFRTYWNAVDDSLNVVVLDING